MRAKSLTAQIQEIVVLQAANGLQLASDVELLGGVEEVLDAGVGIVVAAKDLLGLLDPVRHAVSSSSESEARPGDVLVRPVDILHGQNGQVSVVSGVAQGDSGAGLDAELVELGLVHVERDGHAEEGAIGETVVADNSADGVRLVVAYVWPQHIPVVVLFGHEPWGRRNKVSFHGHLHARGQRPIAGHGG